MVIDVHCHILPDIDDGAKNERITKRMLMTAYEEGIEGIVATSHFFCGSDSKRVQRTQLRYQEVRKWWKKLNPENELYLGNELYYGEGIVDALEQGLALTMNGTRYVLVEFPVYAEFSTIRTAVQKLMYAGYVPILAHIERYECLKKKAEVQELAEMGAYMQTNASAVLGDLGFRKKHFLLMLMKNRLIHFIGTDAHGSRKRKPQIRQCRQYLEKKLGEAAAYRLLEENPEKMLKGETIDG